MATSFYPEAYLQWGTTNNYELDDATANEYLALLLRGDGVTPNFDVNDLTVTNLLADAQNTELTATGYARKGLSSVTFTKSGTQALWKAANIVFAITGTGQDVQAVVIFKDNGAGDGNKKLILFHDFTQFILNGKDVTVRTNDTDGTDTIFTMG